MDTAMERIITNVSTNMLETVKEISSPGYIPNKGY